jgi:hypothetical protein
MHCALIFATSAIVRTVAGFFLAMIVVIGVAAFHTIFFKSSTQITGVYCASAPVRP